MKRLFCCVLLAAACSSSHDQNSAGDVDTPPIARDLEAAIAESPDLQRAAAALDSGHPWRATQILAPVLRDTSRRSPAALLLAARAAGGWGGWTLADSVLRTEAWVDTAFGGEGRELLTRAALDRDADTTALPLAEAAVHDATNDQVRAVRRVLLARALERNNMFDSAAAVYRAAAGALNPVRDWLLLRVAGNQSDSAARAATFANVSLATAKPRVPWTDAQARERFSDALGAAHVYESLGATVSALRLRLSVASDSAARDTLRIALLHFVRDHAGSSDARSAVDVLDHAFTKLAPADELTIARSAAGSGPVARAVAAFQRASAQPALLTAHDHYLYGQVLARAGRSRDAMAQFDAVTGPLAADAAYERARVLLTAGTGDQTRAALRAVAARYPSDVSAASSALYLLADLSTDVSADDAARKIFREVYTKYPNSARASSARFRAAMITWVHDKPSVAARAFDSLAAVMPRSSEATAARYWAGRAWAAAGDRGVARARWRAVLSQDPTSYYALVSARKLDTAGWAPPQRADSFPSIPAVDSAMQRIDLLDQLGMDAEVRFEYDALEQAASASTGRLLATAHAFVEHRQTSRAIHLAQKLLDGGARDARTYRLLYPMIDQDELARDATANGLDPALVAGLIRQESSFTPHALSVAGARGLMQVLPSVGQEVARSLSFPMWSPSLLYDPDANLEIGTAHLAAFSKQYGALPRVLAAYNAGGSRVDRWSAKAGTDDPDVFIERIPFVETRDYVRIVQRNAWMYGMLYGEMGKRH